MFSFPIGVILHAFRRPYAEALDMAAALGAQGIQVHGVKGEVTVDMDGAKRRAFLGEVRARGLAISALCGDMGHGFGDPEKNVHTVAHSKRILDLALELDTKIVTTHIGVVPSDPAHPRYRIMQDACGELARYADSVGAHFAIETGPETAQCLRDFLDSLHSTGVSVNLDPANLVMVMKDDSVRAVYTLGKYIVHTHAKDGRQLFFRDPEKIYGLIPMTEEERNTPSYKEVPLGEGDVDFPAYLRALDEVGYQGFLTIEREVGNTPGEDIAGAFGFLKKLTS